MDELVTSPINLVPYILVVIIYVCLSLTSSVTRNRFFHLTAVGLLICFAGLRNPFTPDADRYRYFYEHFRDSDFQRVVEPSFFLIARTLNAFSLDYHVLFLLYTAATILFMYEGIRNLTPYVKTSMLLYLLVPHLFLGLFIEMRQDCAISIVFYAMSLLRKEHLRHRVAKIIFLAALSIAFHYSAAFYWVVFLITIPLLKRTFSFRTYGFVLLCSLLAPPTLVLRLILLGLYPVLPAAYQEHADGLLQLGVASGQHSLLSLLIYNSLSLIFCYARRINRDIPIDLTNLFVIGAVILNLTRLYGDIARVANYFIVFEIVLLPIVLFGLRKRAIKPLLIYCTLLLYSLHFVHGLYYFNEEANGYIFLHYSSAFMPEITW
jgi:EpsG-like putative glucosyltransferase